MPGQLGVCWAAKGARRASGGASCALPSGSKPCMGSPNALQLVSSPRSRTAQSLSSGAAPAGPALCQAPHSSAAAPSNTQCWCTPHTERPRASHPPAGGSRRWLLAEPCTPPALCAPLRPPWSSSRRQPLTEMPRTRCSAAWRVSEVVGAGRRRCLPPAACCLLGRRASSHRRARSPPSPHRRPSRPGHVAARARQRQRQEVPHHHLWLPDEQRGQRAHGGQPGDAGLQLRGGAQRRRRAHLQHLLHPREGGAEAVQRAGAAGQAQAPADGRPQDRGGGLRGGAGGAGAAAPRARGRPCHGPPPRQPVRQGCGLRGAGCWGSGGPLRRGGLPVPLRPARSRAPCGPRPPTGRTRAPLAPPRPPWPPPPRIGSIGDLLGQVDAGNQVVATDHAAIEEDITAPRRDSDITAWVNVIHGCNEKARGAGAGCVHWGGASGAGWRLPPAAAAGAAAGAAAACCVLAPARRRQPPAAARQPPCIPPPPPPHPRSAPTASCPSRAARSSRAPRTRSGARCWRWGRRGTRR